MSLLKLAHIIKSPAYAGRKFRSECWRRGFGCPRCGCTSCWKHGKLKNGLCKYRCQACRHVFSDQSATPLKWNKIRVDRIAAVAYLSTDDPYLLGILNSRLFWFVISHIGIPFGVRAGQYRYWLIYQYMEKVPIRVIDPNNGEEKQRHYQIVELVRRMLAQHQRKAIAKTPHEQESIKRKTEATDRQIDQQVYELYGFLMKDVEMVNTCLSQS